VDYVYDLVGKIQQVNDPTGTYAFAYDNIPGRVARPLILNLRVPHLSRRVTGGVFDLHSFIGNCTSLSPMRTATRRRSPMTLLAA
jgi:hypothetical protein